MLKDVLQIQLSGERTPKLGIGTLTTCLNDLGRWSLRFEHTTFRMRGRAQVVRGLRFLLTVHSVQLVPRQGRMGRLKGV